MELNSAIENLKRELLTLLNCPKCDFSQHSRAIVPSEPGIYAIYDKTGGRLLYIGESKHLKSRLFGNHLTGDRTASSFRRNLSEWQKLDQEADIGAYISRNACFSLNNVNWQLHKGSSISRLPY